ncbi:MAG: T9SS type A sorting domain-containing protein, partial [Bacteroidota bacterium]
TMEAMSCQNIANGSATLAVNGGVAPYTFLWPTPGDSTNQRTNLVGGFYNVTVLDAAACMDVIGFNIGRVQDTENPEIRTRNTIVYLNEAGEAELQMSAVDGGTTDNCAIERMRLDRSSFSCADLGDEVQITLTAEDKAGNIASETAQITVLDSLPPLLICPNNMILSECEVETGLEYPMPNAFDNCTDASAIELSLVAGIPNGAVAAVGEIEQIFTATDASGNRSECRFMIVIQSLELGERLVATEPSCFNFENGSIQVDTTASPRIVRYAWSIDAPITVSEVQNLTAGEYSLIVTDENGCEYEETILLEDPPLLQVSVDTFTNMINQNGTGHIQITVDGGRLPYRYRWMKDGIFLTEDEDLSDLEVGSYRVQITDANGCSTISQEVQIGLSTSTTNLLLHTHISAVPNPTTGQLYLQLDFPKTYRYTVELYDLTGRKLADLVQQAQGTDVQHELDLSSYENGIYYMKIRVADSILTKRIVVMH